MRIVANQMASPQFWFGQQAEIGNRSRHVRVTGLVLPIIIRGHGRFMFRSAGIAVIVRLIMTVEVAHRDRRRDMINQMQTACRRWPGKTYRAAEQRHQSEKFPHQIHSGWIFSII